jgi:hypothetical protein
MVAVPVGREPAALQLRGIGERVLPVVRAARVVGEQQLVQLVAGAGQRHLCADPDGEQRLDGQHGDDAGQLGRLEPAELLCRLGQ